MPKANPPATPAKATRICKTFNFEGGYLQVSYNQKTDTDGDNDGDEPAVVMLYDTIGGDPWGGRGVTAADFKKVLDEVKGKDLDLRLNSKGGDVHEGLAIKHMLDQWPGKVTCTIDGVAASTASWIPMGCDEVRASKNSQIFIHDAMAFGMGNAEDLRKTADNLDKTSDQIAGMYAEKTGKGVRTMRQMMRDETLLTGEEAEELGLVDTLTDKKATYNFTPDELLKMKEKLKALNSAAPKGPEQKPPTQIMNRQQMLALLNEHGAKIANDATDEQLQAALKDLLKTKKTEATNAAPDDLAGIKAQIQELKTANDTLKNANTEAKRIRVTNVIEGFINNDQLPAGLKDKAIARAMADEAYIDELRAMPARPVGADPLSAGRVELVGDSFKDVQNFMLENGTRFTRKFINAGASKLGEMDEYQRKKACMEIRDRAVLVANTYGKHRKMLTSMFNTNSIDSELQRVVILQEMVEEFAVVLEVLQDFSVVFNNVPLEGTDKVAVPFYPLSAAASQSWDPANGYDTFADTATQMREVAVGGSGSNSGANAAANTAKDRKYIGMKFSSYELRRQPYLNVQKLAIQNANKLGVDVFTDIVSRVITAGNYGASIKSVAPASFSGDDIADLWENATGRNWPEKNRSLTLAHTYKTPLLKDPTFKQYLASGDTETLRKAAISEAYGFENINTVPNLTAYSPAGEFLVGWINWLYAMLVATSPIMPTEEVRQLLTRYDVVVHPKVGIAFEYRRFGDTTLDSTKEVVECSYGAELGVATALARLTSQ